MLGWGPALYGMVFGGMMSLLSRPVVRTVTISAAVFVFDLLTPLGIAAHAMYFAAVLSAVAIGQRRATYITAAVCTALVFVGAALSPGRDSAIWPYVIVNRLIYLLLIWASAFAGDVWIEYHQWQRRRLRENQLINQATALSASRLSFRDSLNNALKTLCDIFGWPIAHVYVRDQSGRIFSASDVWYATNPGDCELLREAARGLQFSSDDIAVGQVWKTGEPLAVENISDSPGYSWLTEPERFDVVAAFLLPITIRGKVVAVMECFSGKSTQNDVDLLPTAKNFGEQLGRLFERQKAEQVLRRSEQRLKLAIQGGGMGMWEWNLTSGQVTWSPELEAIHGLTPGSFPGTFEAVQQEVHPEDRERLAAAIDDVLKAGGEYRVEYRIIQRDGTVRWLEGRAAYSPDADVTPARMVGVCMDITERKSMQERDARLAAIVQASDDAIFSKALDGTILTWNAGAERMYGYRAAEMIGESVTKLLAEGFEAEFASNMEKIQRGQHVDHFETRRRRKDGRVIDVAITITAITDSAGTVVSAATVARDITDRKAVEQEMRAARQKAEAAQQMQTRFLAKVSHELRTPMNSVLGMLQLSLDSGLPPQVRSWLMTARFSADSLLVLLNDLLDLSKIEAGKLTIHPKPIQLRQELDELTRAFATPAFKKGLELMCDVAADVPDDIITDPHRFRQILGNLVTNAVKFTDLGEVVITVHRERDAEAEVLQVSVTDTGVGIQVDDQDRIFSAFVQTDATHDPHRAGAGLGLAISRELVRCMGGALHVSSCPGRGSRFWFSLPLETVDAPATGELVGADVEQLRDQTVLVVDRNKTNREMLARWLGEWAMVVDTAADYRHALSDLCRAEVERGGYRLVIGDAATISLSATTLVQQLAGSLHQVPAVVMMKHLGAALGDDGDGETKQPAVVYLEKPVSLSRLLVSVQQVLHLHVSLAPQPVTPPPQTISRPLSILVAEDTPANQVVVTTVLEQRGHRVTVVGDGQQAVEAVERETFDVVLMDIMMPVMDGYQATKTIREREKRSGQRVPVVALTAHVMKEELALSAAVGVDACLAKPIDFGQLIELVEGIAVCQLRDQHGIVPVAAVEPASPAGHANEHTHPELAHAANGPFDSPERAQEVMDYHGSLRRLGGDEALFRVIVHLFQQDAPGLLQTIRQCIDDDCAAELQRAAHSLKGLAANFGATCVVERATCLEQMGKLHCLDGADGVADELASEVARLNEALSPYLADPHANGRATIT